VIHGTVVGLQARMSVLIRSVDGSEIEIDCVIDTGFEGFLTLPLSIIKDFRELFKERNIPLYSHDVEDFALDRKNLREC